MFLFISSSGSEVGDFCVVDPIVVLEPRAFLTSLKTVRYTNMGVEKEVLNAAPEGAKLPTRGSTITVHCTGYGKDRDMSKKFWSTKDEGQQPFTFSVGMGQVIKGMFSRLLVWCRNFAEAYGGRRGSNLFSISSSAVRLPFSVSNGTVEYLFDFLVL